MLHLLHDVHHRLTPIEAGAIQQGHKPFRPFWLEEKTAHPQRIAAFRLIRQHTTTPLAVGEVFSSVWDRQAAHR